MGIYTNYPDSIYDTGAGGGGGDVGAPYLKNIMPTTGVKVVDENGYIGGDFLDVYYPNTNYYNNFAVVIPGADYSSEGLGTVTFVDTTTTIGGRVYRTVTIGGVTWLAENLDYKFSGCGIGGTGTPATPNAWYYDNNEAIYGIDGVRKCGLLYNRYAVELLNENRSELIPGWHVAKLDEWTELINSVGGTSAGNSLKSANVSWASSWNGTDAYGFGVLPSGIYNGSFQYSGTNAFLFSADLNQCPSFDTTPNIQIYGHNKSYGLAVRLVKDP